MIDMDDLNRKAREIAFERATAGLISYEMNQKARIDAEIAMAVAEREKYRSADAARPEHRADKTLADIRDLVDELTAYINANKSSSMPHSARALAESVRELDAWLMRGGALPADWQNDNDADES